MTRRNSSDAIMECLTGYVFLSLCYKVLALCYIDLSSI